MKKFLMTAALAIVVGGSFTSCHDDNVSGELFSQKVEAFEESFVRAFGQPNPNHNWGFARGEAVTRGENANGNQWADPNYDNLLVPPPLTDAQIAVVKKYFQTVPNLGYSDPGWSNYFMQQVYKGHTDVPENCATPEQYLAANNGSYIIASDHMDHLAAVFENGKVDHINNFNHGDCGAYGTVLKNGGNTNEGPFYSDKIMLMENSTTYSFGYYNSDGSLRHTEYTGLVSYQTIIAELGAEANCLDDGWNRSFMGFDFEQMVGSDVYSGATFTFDGKTYHFLSSNTNMYCADRSEKTYSVEGGVAHFNDTPSDAVIRDLLLKGYLPNSDTKKDWVKVGGCADGYFSDWIVCLTEAKTNGTRPSAPQVYEKVDGSTTTGYTNYKIVEGAKVVESGRVLCEDLGSSKLSDIDFNDIVFDAVIVSEYRKLITTYYDADGRQIGEPEETTVFTMDNKTGYEERYALIRLMAAGGTIPATVAGYEVHEAFGGIPTTTMINTTYDRADVNGANIYNSTSAVDLENEDYGTKFYGYRYIYDIPINVKYDNDSKQLTAFEGAAPHKILVPLGVRWPGEIKNIGEAYPQFANYVYDAYTEFWAYPNVGENKENYLYENSALVGLSVPDDKMIEPEVTVYDYTDTSSDPTVSRRLIDATNRKMLTPGSSEHTLFNFETNGPGYLCPATSTESILSVSISGYADAQVGDIVRIYGVSADDWYVHTNIASSDITAYTEEGYIDIPLTQTNLESMQSGLEITGEKFTVTYITIRSTSTNTSGDNTSGDNTGGNNTGGDNTGGNNTDGTKVGQIWPATGTSSATSLSLDGSLLQGKSSSSVLRIYGDFDQRDDNWFQAGFRFGNWADITNVANWPEQGDKKWAYANSSARNNNLGCLEMPLENIISKAANTTLEFSFQAFTAKQVTIE